MKRVRLGKDWYIEKSRNGIVHLHCHSTGKQYENRDTLPDKNGNIAPGAYKSAEEFVKGYLEGQVCLNDYERKLFDAFYRRKN